jgi:hypothetical protein
MPRPPPPNVSSHGCACAGGVVRVVLVPCNSFCKKVVLTGWTPVRYCNDRVRCCFSCTRYLAFVKMCKKTFFSHRTRCNATSQSVLLFYIENRRNAMKIDLQVRYSRRTWCTQNPIAHISTRQASPAACQRCMYIGEHDGCSSAFDARKAGPAGAARRLHAKRAKTCSHVSRKPCPCCWRRKSLDR